MTAEELKNKQQIVNLLNSLKELCEDAVKNMVLPTAVQKGDTKVEKRPPEIYKMRLTDSKSYKKFAPYEIIQLVNTNHVQKPRDAPRYFATVRFIFCVTCEDEQEGSMMLLDFMETVHARLLNDVRVGKLFLLNVNEPLEMLVYTEDSAPFYGGEMVGTFVLPGIEREVDWNGLKSQQIGKRI